MRHFARLDRGSVVMEFLMVLPIYFALIGGTFWVGELFIARDNVLVSDRLASNHWGGRHDRDNDRRNQNDNMMLTRLNLWSYNFINGGAVGDSPIVVGVKQTRALVNQYAWAQVVGGKVSLYVPQPSWTRGWLHGYDDIWEETLAGVRQSSSFQDAINLICSLPDDVFGMNSRVSTRNFLNVSLMRTKGGEKSYRAFKPAQLCHECNGQSLNAFGKRICVGIPVMNAIWYEKVYDEKYPYHRLEDLDNRMSEGARDDAVASPPDQKDYARFPSYVLWSQ